MAQVTYYFNAYSSESFDSNPDNVVDGNTATQGQDNDAGENMRLSTNTCPGTDLGTITAVEIRYYRNYNNYTGTWGWFIPYFDGTDAGTQVDDTPSANGLDYTPWFDITDDAAGPGTWAWSDVVALDLAMGLTRPSWGLINLYIVEVRVTYTEPSGDSYYPLPSFKPSY